MLVQKQLHSRFKYKNGQLFYRKQCGRKKIGEKCGTMHHSGRCQIIVNGKHYFRHQVIFVYFYGYLPKIIDHINNDKTDDRIENLRPANQMQNCQNRKKHNHYRGKKCSSKYKGVSWKKSHKKWAAYISVNGKRLHLGLFENEALAASAYNCAAIKYFGDFANINKI